MAVIFGGLASFIYLVGTGTNTFESVITICNLNGLDLEVENGSFDGIGKDEWVNVYAWKAGSRDSAFSRLLHRRTKLFNYDPWNSDSAPPVIKADVPRHITISLPRVSSVSLEVGNFRDVVIGYKIDKVEYPRLVRTK
jgi:hypothetical protein